MAKFPGHTEIMELCDDAGLVASQRLFPTRDDFFYALVAQEDLDAQRHSAISPEAWGSAVLGIDHFSDQGEQVVELLGG